jgi:phage head maturation protease
MTLTQPILRATKLSPVALDDPLPPGVIGRVQGIALVYDVLDDHGTSFQRGCLERTARERVAAGKVRLFVDHGGAPINGGMYLSEMHVGTVRSLTDTVVDGQACAVMVADLFDTEQGRAAWQYLKAVQATDGEVGLSVGFIGKGMKSTRALVEGQMATVFTEVPLREISITAVSSVPGTAVTAVRSAPLDYEPFARGMYAALGDEGFRAMLARILGDAEAPTDSDAGADARPDSDAAPLDSPPPDVPAAPSPMPYAERLRRYRALIQ